MTNPIQAKIDLIKSNENDYFVAELETGYVVLGEWCYFNGYTLFLCKETVAELHELDWDFRVTHLQEMSLVAEAVCKTFKPRKLNYELLGNQCPHIHWHFFPRYGTDEMPRASIWEISESIRQAEALKLEGTELKLMKRELLASLESLEKLKIISKFETGSI
ncbi:MAG: HIT family protein [Bdellovibrionales bacterium]|nr:HIT family protein [Bdellovibrionales bacterium]